MLVSFVHSEVHMLELTPQFTVQRLKGVSTSINTRVLFRAGLEVILMIRGKSFHLTELEDFRPSAPPGHSPKGVSSFGKDHLHHVTPDSKNLRSN